MLPCFPQCMVHRGRGPCTSPPHSSHLQSQWLSEPLPGTFPQPAVSHVLYSTCWEFIFLFLIVAQLPSHGNTRQYPISHCPWTWLKNLSLKTTQLVVWGGGRALLAKWAQTSKVSTFAYNTELGIIKCVHITEGNIVMKTQKNAHPTPLHSVIQQILIEGSLCQRCWTRRSAT